MLMGTAGYLYKRCKALANPVLTRQTAPQLHPALDSQTISKSLALFNLGSPQFPGVMQQCDTCTTELAATQAR